MKWWWLLGGSTNTKLAVQIPKRVSGVNAIEGFSVMTESPLQYVGFIGGYRIKELVITAFEWRVFG